MIVGIWLPAWDLSTHKRTFSGQTGFSISDLWPPGMLGAAMVARGEIGLLIVEIGVNHTSYVSNAGFYTAVWAILLNTIVGRVTLNLEAIDRGDLLIQSQGQCLSA